MTSQIYGATLIWLLEKLAAVQSTLRDERVVVFSAEIAGTTKALRNYTNCLELGSRIADTLLVNSECLCEELVCNLLEPTLVGNRTARDEKSQGKISHPGGRDPRIQCRDQSVTEFVKG